MPEWVKAPKVQATNRMLQEQIEDMLKELTEPVLVRRAKHLRHQIARLKKLIKRRTN
jgi:hypothetical protein